MTVTRSYSRALLAIVAIPVFTACVDLTPRWHQDAGGKFTDIEAAAKLLKGRTVAQGTRLVVTMATREIVKRSLDAGYYQILLEAGAAITSPNCGACSGLLGGIMAAHERCVSTANRNFPGRMGGATEAEVFLVSPVTAAAVAITGRLNAAEAL